MNFFKADVEKGESQNTSQNVSIENDSLNHSPNIEAVNPLWKIFRLPMNYIPIKMKIAL